MDDIFTWGLIIGYLTGCITGIVLEAFCVIASKSDEESGKK